MRFVRSGAVVVLMALVGCRERPAADSTDVEVVPPVASASSSAQPIEREAVSVLGTWRLPRGDAAATLGTECNAEATRHWKPEAICGVKNRVSVELQYHALLDARPPCEMVDVSPESSAYKVTGCIDGDLMLFNSHCVMCRVMDAGTAVRARLSELTPRQLENLRNDSGLGEAAPKTVEGWRALFAKR